MVLSTCHPSEGVKLKVGRLQSRSAWAKSKIPAPKIRAKKTGGAAQPVEHLPLEV
jgi:hypothetical protein